MNVIINRIRNLSDDLKTQFEMIWIGWLQTRNHTKVLCVHNASIFLVYVFSFRFVLFINVRSSVFIFLYWLCICLISTLWVCEFLLVYFAARFDLRLRAARLLLLLKTQLKNLFLCSLLKNTHFACLFFAFCRINLCTSFIFLIHFKSVYNTQLISFGIVWIVVDEMSVTRHHEQQQQQKKNLNLKCLSVFELNV